MIFTFRKWERFCEKLQQMGVQSIPAKDVTADLENYIVLKHDVETNVANSFKMAKIEWEQGHRGSYYVQAYLLDSKENLELLRHMRDMGHEVSYHYDVMDCCKGNLEKAVDEFESNRKLFENQGFALTTVCQHGNPVVERVGYSSNRDFFRSEKVKELYPNLADIMVDYPEKYQTKYAYFSDAGRVFKRIFDPINNDVTPSDEKNIAYKDLGELLGALDFQKGNIISTHPHRWMQSALIYLVKSAVFKAVKAVTKLLLKIPFMKKFLSKFYTLAKKL